MRIETIYYADDGTEFDTEEECRQYESAITDGMDSCLFYDGDMKKIEGGFEEIWDHTEYVAILDEEKVKPLFNYLWDMYGFKPPMGYNTGDIFAWNAHDETWSDLKEEFYTISCIMGVITKDMTERGVDVG